MLKNKLTLVAACAVIYFTGTSSISGYSSNMTGSHGAGTGCGSCHGNSATSGITVAIELDSAGVPVTSYVPGMSYTIKLTGTNTTTSNLPGFGLQMSVVSGSGSTSANAGTLTATASGTSIRTGASSIKYLSHSTRINATSGSGGSGTTYVVSANWTAPAAGTGNVTAYGLINAVNGDNNDGSSDKWNTGNATFTERVSHTGVAEVAHGKYQVYPNPATGIVKITNYSGPITVVNAAGQVVLSAEGQADLGQLPAGSYLVTFRAEGVDVTRRIVKQ